MSHQRRKCGYGEAGDCAWTVESVYSSLEDERDIPVKRAELVMGAR